MTGKLNNPFVELWRPHRYKVFYGGRGSGKSFAVAEALIVMADMAPIRVLACREIQNSIKDSSYQLLKDTAIRLGLAGRFRFLDSEIRHTLTGSRFIFKGLSHNEQSVKSTEGIDICWCFVPGTLVDGKPIEQVRVGDFVRSFNHKTQTIEYRRVLRVMKRPAPRRLYKLTHGGSSEHIISTGEHPYFVKGRGYVPVSEMSPGDIVYACKIGHSCVCSEERFVLEEQRVECVEIQEQGSSHGNGEGEGGNFVFNLEVEGNNNYFAGDVLVHNCEEAQTISESSWKTLIPTIRAPGSEIWVTFNPLNIDDPTTKRFIENPPPDAYTRKVNYDENPYFPEELRKEMEWCRETDYESYLHVWEGFPRTISDAQIFRGKFTVESFPDDLWQKADRLFFGTDFGFANDPTAMVRCFVFDNRLYIDYEAYKTKVEIDQLPAFYRTVPEVDNWPIHADGARPETISYLANRVSPPFRISAAKKWQGSVEDGIAYLKSFDKIVIHPRCKYTADEFRLYSYKVDKTTGEVLPLILDKFNHAVDALRYALDGYITKPGISKWARIR